MKMHVIRWAAWTEENWILIPGEEALQDERVLAFGTAQTKVLKYDRDSRTWAPTRCTSRTRCASTAT